MLFIAVVGLLLYIIINNISKEPSPKKHNSCSHNWVYWDHLADECTKCGDLKQTRGF